MENVNNTLRGSGVHTFPKGVAQCEGIHRKSWMTNCVSLKNEVSVVVCEGIFHKVCSDLIINSDNQPLGDDLVAIQIAESLSEHNISSKWLFQLRSWHISCIFLNGASLYDHEQMNLFNLTLVALHWRSWVDVHAYESSQEGRNS